MTGESPILAAALALSEVGIGVHWLWQKSKKPILDGWAAAPVETPESLRKSYRPGYNVGIRPGIYSPVGKFFLHVLDLDVRDENKAAEAYAWLDERWPEWRRFPTVQSGSGGSSRHVYFFMREAHRSRGLARSQEKCEYQGNTPWAWQIDLYGSGRQVAAPPSIHPLTGKPYRWLVPLDLELLDLGCIPVLDAELAQSWRSPSESTKDEPLNDNKLGLTTDEAREILSKLSLDEWCENRDGWYRVGMCLHHEFGDEGRELWDEFSAQSDKFDPETQEKVWRSFRNRPGALRMATLKAEARKVEIVEAFDDLTDDDSEDDSTESEDDSEDDLLGFETEQNTGKQTDSLSAAEIAAALPPKKPPPDLEWTSKLDLNEEGAIKPTLHNVTLMIRNDRRTCGLMALNQFTQEVVQRGKPGTLKKKRVGPKGLKQLEGPIWHLDDPINGDLWTDPKDDAVRDILEAPKSQGGYGIKVSDRDLASAISIVGRENAFHPVREYLESTPWDGRERVEQMFVKYFGAPDNAYTRSVTRLMLLAGVTRIYEPGHKFDFAVILEGFQGKRKSTFISILAHKWFAELKGDFHDTRMMVEMMQGSWILEIPELSQFAKSDVRIIKGFISCQVDKARLAYARRAQTFPRQSIFIGSTNDGEYLRDETGGRRFWPIECRVDEVDTDAFAAEVDQIWAEALTLYRAMRAEQPYGTLPLYLADSVARQEAERLQESRRIETAEDAFAGQIADWLDAPILDESGFEDLDDLIGAPKRRNETCLVEIWVECLGRNRSDYGTNQATTLGRAMRQLEGWFKAGVRPTERYGRQKVYRRFGYDAL